MSQSKLFEFKQKIWKRLTQNLNYEDYVWIESKYEYWREKDKEALWGHRFFISKKGKEKYCILRNKFPHNGVFATANQYLFMYQWAKENGYIPLMDWETIYTYKKRNIGEYNLWEICFELPVSVKEAVKKKWVLVESVGVGNKISENTCMRINGVKNDWTLHFRKENWRQYYRVAHDYAKQCWKIKSSFLDEFMKQYASCFSKGKRVIGVSLREEFSVDAMALRDNKEVIEVYNRHPLTPGVKDIIQQVKICKDKWKCDYIFVATMCLDSIEAFRETFGENVIFYVDRKRLPLAEMLKQAAWDGLWDKSDEEINQIAMSGETKDNMIGYVQEILGLSKCDYLVAASCSGSIAALVMNGGKYEEVEFLPDFHQSKNY